MKKRKILFWNALIGTKEILGRKHPDAFTDMDHLASMLQDQRKYEEAVTLNWQVLKDTEEVLGSKHPDTKALITFHLAKPPCPLPMVVLDTRHIPFKTLTLLA